MTSITRIDANHRRARANIAGDFIFLTGQCADDKTADIRQQTRETLAKIDSLLVQCGGVKTRISSVTIWLRDMADYDGLNEVWDAWVVKGYEPCRACAKVELFDPQYRVEMIVTAMR
jgi:enamine deaminase RidA (YjgF/YER057c/UK114 family)